MWGGDLQAFVLQAAPRGLMKDRVVVLSASDHVLPPLGNKMPDGVIVGARYIPTGRNFNVTIAPVAAINMVF